MYVTPIVLLALMCKLEASVSESLHSLSDEFIDEINWEGKWLAGRNFPADTPMEYLQNLMGARIDLPQLKKYPTVHHDREVIKDLPESFDPRDEWPECPTLNEIRDQGQCGACWAFSAVEVMSDRVCISSNGTKHFHFSAQDLVTCDSKDSGCNGGSLDGPWSIWIEDGIVSGGNYNSQEGCLPYSFPTCKNHLAKCTKYKATPQCVRSCQEGYNVTYEDDKKRGKDMVIFLMEEDIKAELYLNGPVMASFAVYADFANYKDGVYEHLKGELLGGHAIKVMGWGVENGTAYWLAANSWGSDFGNNGFFKFLRGVPIEDEFEMIALATTPLLEDY